MTRHADERAGHGLTSRRTLIKGIVALAGAVMMAPAGVPTVAQAQTPGSTGNEPPVQPPTTITNPFPNGLVPTLKNSLGTLTGVGTNISYVDQTSGAPRVQQYSVDVQRQLTSTQSITLSYIGSRGDDLSLGGSNDAAVNINQLDPKYMALGAALNDTVANPFFGNANAGPFATSSTIARRQLLRPFPQFGDILARHVLEGKSRYNAFVAEWTKRVNGTFGGRVSYTYSNLKDNQMAESNFYSAGGLNPLNNYNFMSNMPACTTTNFAACYNPDAEYAVSLLDVPHRVILAPVLNVPFKSSNPIVNGIIGDWVISGAINLQAGFPISVQQSDNTGTFSGVQRPNLVSGVDLSTPGSYADRLASADHPTATWVNPAAFSLAPNFTFGNAPRTITDIRTPGLYNTDLSLIKNFRLGGRTLQVKMEALNLMNRVAVRTLQGRNTFGNANFGQTNTQSGFMRIYQFMLRFNF